MRSPSITFTKATAIMLMVLCHAGHGSEYVNDYVYMFHMPLFFFLSGYCLKTEYFSQPHVFVWKRVRGLWWPYVKWSVLFLLLHNVFFGLNLYNGEYGFHGEGSQLYAVTDIAERLQGILLHMQGLEQLLGGYWFLRALFFGSLIAFALLWIADVANRYMKLKPACGMLFGGGYLLALCIWLDHAHRTLTVLYLSPTDMAAALFFLIGHAFRRLKMRKLRSSEMLVAALLVLVGSCFWPMGLGVPFYDNCRLLPYILTAVLGTWAICSLPWGRLTGRTASLMQLIGSNTLTVLTWHFLAFKLVSLLIIYVYGLPMARLAEFPVITDYAVQGWWLAYFLVAMAATCAIACCNRWIKSPWLKL